MLRIVSQFALAFVKFNLWVFCVMGTTFLAVGALSALTGIPFLARAGGLLPASVFTIVGSATAALGWTHALAQKRWQFSMKDLVFHTAWLGITLAVITQWPTITALAMLFAISAFLWYERDLVRSDLGLPTTRNS